MSLREGMIVGLCNPLLDISAEVHEEFLKEHKLDSNAAILGDDSNIHIYANMEAKYDVDYMLGGSAQNTMRCVAALIKQPNVACYMGCVGKDKYSEIMATKAKELGLNVVYQITDQKPTGRCAVLVNGKNRSLVAHLDAANHFTIDHLKNADNWRHIEQAQIVYVSGFFFTVCQEAIMKIAEYTLEQNRLFCTNLSATFVSQFYKDRFQAALPHVKLLFGNDDEAKAFSKHILEDENEDVASIASKIANRPSSFTSQKRIVIITQGPAPVILAIGDEVRQFEVPKLDESKVIDTNGAGDAFVGGFFASYLKGDPIEKCIQSGIKISSLVVQRHGCTFPEDMEL